MDEPRVLMTIKLLMLPQEFGNNTIVNFEIDPTTELYAIPEADRLKAAVALRRLADAFESYIPFGQIVTPEKVDV